ncbi:MAG: glycosyl hydrolase [Gemmatimonadetes bacterium]|nr:glycosyl hydrolase [Gemmatimonadota bacterium]
MTRPVRSRSVFGSFAPAPSFALLAAGLALATPNNAVHAQVGVDQAAAALTLREIGPAVAGGRISDIAVHPHDPSTWYIGVGSGGVWKTTNAGTTFTPIFDEQPSYSIGEIALDPSNPEVVWVGSGENVSGRHVAWGTGVYRSRDGGQTWESMGLDASEHIGKILIHPDDSDVVLVAAEGPLWSAGGERGVYRSDDGGESWTAVLTVDEHTGVTDLEFAPDDPSTVYAATFQRRRHVWGYMAGGPGSGIWKSTDAGASWREVTTGLPTRDMGKIGLAVTPADPDRVYATIESNGGQEGFYRSLDRGESWEHRTTYISGGTGPHYYQEIEASPTEPDVVIQMDVFFQVTYDGGATFDNLETGRDKHSDNHALWIDPANPLHMLGGTDAGLYETFDRGTTWRHFPNMPIAQFYKVAASNSEPFYEVLAGAQDLGTLWAPARTQTTEGVRNEDWLFPMGADGYGVAFDPTDANIVYLMTQQGNLYRSDMRSGEAMPIQPQPAPGDPAERWNWDSPILVSPHDSDRIYFASQRLWVSDNRGDDWTAISGDLTTDTDRYTLPYMGRVWEMDALHDNGAMSKYATITTLSESPVAAGTIYTGSDDGLIHMTTDGGASWTQAAPLPGVPERSFINKVVASELDAETVFALADAHKVGDYAPYLFRSNDRGASWTSIRGDLPDGELVWALQQDHEEAGLLILAGETSLWFTIDGGGAWHRLDAGAPTIAYRDVQLQRRDDDIIGGTFGRGIFILDDYAPLRALARGVLAEGGGVMPVRDAWWYVPWQTNQATGRPTLGSTAWAGPNPAFGATFTVHVPELPQTAEDARRASERELRDSGADAPFPGYETLRAERAESGPRVMIRVADASGSPVRDAPVPAREGVHRVTWDLRHPAPDPVSFFTPSFRPPWVGEAEGPLAAPGRYSAQLVVVSGREVREVGSRQAFEVRPVPTVPAGTDLVAVAEFHARTADLQRAISIASSEMGQASERIRFMREALGRTPTAPPSLYTELDALERTIADFRLRLQGDPVRGSLSQSSVPSISSRAGRAASGWGTRQNPTGTMRDNLEIAEADFAALEAELAAFLADDVAWIERALAAAGAPWTPGRRLGGGGSG